jgi:hypothetical protein
VRSGAIVLLPDHASVGNERLASRDATADLVDRSDILPVVCISAPGEQVDWRLGTQGLIGVVEGVAGRMEAVLDEVRAIGQAVADYVVISPA